VFYELLAGASPSLRKSLKLPRGLDQQDEVVEGGWMEEYRYMNQSGCYERRDGVDDALQFRHTAVAMKDIGLNKTCLGFTVEDEEAEVAQQALSVESTTTSSGGGGSVGCDENEESIGFSHVLKIVAAVLHLGNLLFESYLDEEARAKEKNSKSQGATAVDGPPPVKTRAAIGRAAALLAKYGQESGGGGGGGQVELKPEEEGCAASFALKMTSEMLGVDPDGLSSALCSRKIEVNVRAVRSFVRSFFFDLLLLLRSSTSSIFFYSTLFFMF
jgi:hypothetical protein